MAGSRSGIATVTRQVHDANRQRSAFFLAGVAACLAQGTSALAQLWLSASQLQAPPAADAVAHGAQTQRRVGLHGTLHAGHAAIDAATLERTPQTEVPVLRIGDGDRAPAHRARGNAG